MFGQLGLLVAQSFLIAVPFVLAGLGGTCSERGGVVNIALEGILLGGAFATAVVAYATGSAWAGLCAAIAAGLLVAALHALLCLVVRVDQIISGLAINLFVTGATEFGAHLLWPASASRTIPRLPQFDGAYGLGAPLVVGAVLLVPLVDALLSRTRFGLRLTAAGENPLACSTLGISVERVRWAGVLLSGLLAGLGGAYLAFNIQQFQHGMSAGKGFIAMAAVVSGRWRPWRVSLACLLFGASGALAGALERWGVRVPSELISMLPYAITLIVVSGVVGRSRAPAALGHIPE